MSVSAESTTPRWRLAWLPLAAALVAALGQRLLDAGRWQWLGLAFLVLAAVIFGWSAAQGPERTASGAIAADSTKPRSWWLVMAAFGAGLIGVPAFAANRVTTLAGVCWLLGLALLVWAAWPDAPSWRWRIDPAGLRLSWAGLALLAVVVLGAAFRFYHLAELPAEMGCDLPHIHGNIQQILAGEYPVFFPSWPGREGIFFYLAALPARLFGLSHTSIKAASALVGLATLPAVYLLGREVHSREAGIYAAGLMAMAHWHVILTRIGYRLSVMPFLVALGLWAWLRAVRTGQRAYYGICGLALGLGLHSYNAFMVAPVWLLLLAGAAWAAGWGSTMRRHLAGLAFLVVVMAYVALPLATYAAANPGTYLFRVATRLTSQEVPVPARPLWVLAGNAWRAAAMFNLRGDAIATSNVPELRQLGYLPAVLFPLGIAWAVRRWRDPGAASLLVTLPTMLAPTALSLAFPQEVPNAGRAVGALVPAMLVAAIALAELRNHFGALLGRLAPGWRAATMAPALLVVALLVAEAGASWQVYFEDYRASLPAANHSISRQMAAAIDAFAHEGNVYTVVWPHHYDGNAVRAQLTRQALPPSHELPALVAGQPPLDDQPGKRMVILAPEDAASLALLESSFSRGMAWRYVDAYGRATFVAFYGEQ